MQHGALLVSSSRQMPSQKIHTTAMSEMNNSAEKILFDLGGRVHLIKAVAGLFIPAGVALMIGSFWALTSLSALYGSLEPLESRIIFFYFSSRDRPLDELRLLDVPQIIRSKNFPDQRPDRRHHNARFDGRHRNIST
jgi:hypothetical protein